MEFVFAMKTLNLPFANLKLVLRNLPLTIPYVKIKVLLVPQMELAIILETWLLLGMIT